MKPLKTISVVCAAAGVLGVTSWVLIRGRTALLPVGAVQVGDQALQSIPWGDHVFYMLTGKYFLEHERPDETVNVEVRRSWLTGRVKAVKTYRTLDEYRAGASEWYSVAGSSSFFPTIEVTSGIFALPSYANGDDGRSMTLPDASQKRLIELVFPQEIAQKIRDGNFGAIQAKILSQAWETLPKGTKFALSRGSKATDILGEDLGNLIVKIAVTNTTQHAQDYTPDLWIVAKHGILLHPLALATATPQQTNTRVSSITLRPFASRVLLLATGYMFRPDELRDTPPAAIMSFWAGWNWKVTPYSRADSAHG